MQTSPLRRNSRKFTSIERRRSRKSLCAEIARTLVPRLICDTYGSVNGDLATGGESTASSTLRHQHRRHTGLAAFIKKIYNTNIRVIHHFFKQAQNETAIFNVFQDLKSKISEKSDQNWGCARLKTNWSSRTQPISQFWRLPSQAGQSWSSHDHYCFMNLKLYLVHFQSMYLGRAIEFPLCASHIGFPTRRDQTRCKRYA